MASRLCWLNHVYVERLTTAVVKCSGGAFNRLGASGEEMAFELL